MVTNYDKLLEKIRGDRLPLGGMFVKKFRDNENAFPVAGEDKKKWTLERDFHLGRIELYGLNDDNYMNYVPDYQYFMLLPMNNYFLK